MSGYSSAYQSSFQSSMQYPGSLPSQMAAHNNPQFQHNVPVEGASWGGSLTGGGVVVNAAGAVVGGTGGAQDVVAVSLGMHRLRSVPERVELLQCK